MGQALPAELIEADGHYHAIVAAYRYSRFLNPHNGAEAREAFERGREAPPFRYEALPAAEDALDALARLRVPREHPLGVELARAVADSRALLAALHHRSAQAFEDLAWQVGWFPSPPIAIPPEAPPETEPDPGPPVSPEGMAEALRAALEARGYGAWRVELDPVMSARVLVDTLHHEVRVSRQARFRGRDLVGLVAHEVDVHVARAMGGRAQPLRLFATGLPGSASTEEGLAMNAEARVGKLSRRQIRRQAIVADAVLAARHMGFRELHARLRARVGAELAWQVCQRVKRGLADPGAPGVYAKDIIYHQGFHAVRAWIDGGGAVDGLYVGKVSLDHPVGQWVEAGWVQPAAAPSLWRVSPPG